MPKATSALIDIEDALALRETGVKPAFKCKNCGQPVRAHKKGTTDQAAHFEHLQRKDDCPLSD
jgi:competence CoiA-like predicted nuclease